MIPLNDDYSELGLCQGGVGSFEIYRSRRKKIKTLDSSVQVRIGFFFLLNVSKICDNKIIRYRINYRHKTKLIIFFTSHFF